MLGLSALLAFIGIIMYVFIPVEESGLSNYDGKKYIGGFMLVYSFFLVIIGGLAYMGSTRGNIHLITNRTLGLLWRVHLLWVLIVYDRVFFCDYASNPYKYEYIV